MLRVRNAAAIDYRLCNQTVTIYHQTGAGERFSCTCTVFHGAFLDFRKTQSVDKTGSRDVNTFLLVLPSGVRDRPVWASPEEFAVLDEKSGRFTLSPGDKVCLGEGQEVSSREAWASLLPGKTTGTVVIRDVDPKYFQGAVTHVEAGG